MGGELFCKKEEEEHLEHTPLHLKLRKIVLQNYLIFVHKGISEPSANPGLIGGGLSPYFVPLSD